MLQLLKKYNIIKLNHKLNSNTNKILKKHPLIYQQILDSTSFLPPLTSTTERIYCIINNILNIQKCYCSLPTKFVDNITGYRKYCSSACGSKHTIRQIKAKETKLKRYGDENYCNKEKIKKTYKNKSQEEIDETVNKIKQTKLKRYKDKNWNNVEKYKETWKNKSQEEIHIGIKKQKETKKERYGDENYCNKEKIKQTKKERYGDENYSNREKAKETKSSRYGDENYCNIKQRKQTSLKKYNHTNILASSYGKIKSKQTKLNKYDNENYNNREKAKETCLKRYNRNNSQQQYISEDSWNKLNDKRWLKEQHYDNCLSLSQIADILNINNTTISNYFRYYKLHIKWRGAYCNKYFKLYPERKYINSNLYIIKCYNEIESFIKIGITIRTIKSRYSSFEYNYKILNNKELPLQDAFQAEQDILNQFKELSYSPDIKFDGYTECLNESCYEDVINYLT